MAVRIYGLDMVLGLWELCDLDLQDMTLFKGHDTPFGHGQQLCKILSGSNMTVKSNCLDTHFGYVCTVTLTLEIWPWVKAMAQRWPLYHGQQLCETLSRSNMAVVAPTSFVWYFIQHVCRVVLQKLTSSTLILFLIVLPYWLIELYINKILRSCTFIIYSIWGFHTDHINTGWTKFLEMG